MPPVHSLQIIHTSGWLQCQFAMLWSKPNPYLCGWEAGALCANRLLVWQDQSVLLSAPAQLAHTDTEPITISVQYIILLVPYSPVRCPFSVLQIPCLIMRSKKFSTSPYQLHASYPQPLMPSKSRKKPSASAGAYPSLSGYSNSVRIPRDSGRESIMAVFGSEQIPKI